MLAATKAMLPTTQNMNNSYSMKCTPSGPLQRPEAILAGGP